ncbi:MAG: hypothetical protein DRP71_16525 [Verrucomicrobia bacterium]|nr:MAG: hypothetical protein DRP71_16525 [Verrucomicrobiota bacterium]
MSLYGNPKPTTPFLDAFAKKNVYFEYAQSQETSTPPSVASYFTGVYPTRYLGIENFPSLLGNTPTLATEFRKAGFDTALFTDNPFLAEKSGFHRGFDTARVYDWRSEAKEGEYFRGTRASEEMLKDVKKWIGTATEKPWLCYLHVLRPHNPYFVPAPYDKRFQDTPSVTSEQLEIAEKYVLSWAFLRLRGDRTGTVNCSESELSHILGLYHGNLNYADSYVERLLSFLETSGFSENTVLIVTSDHGESFMEHGELLHATEPYEELIHVPLILSLPSDPRFSRKHVRTPVQLVDLAPTLFEFFDLPSPPGLSGQSLLPLLESGATKTPLRPLFSQAYKTDTVAIRKDFLKAMVTWPAGAEAPSRIEVYDLAQDPEELNDLARGTKSLTKEQQELVAEAKSYFSTAHGHESTSEETDLTDEQEDQLRALGYVE